MLNAIDMLVRAQVDLRGPGVAVAVVKDGSLLYCKGHGFANLEWEQPVGPDTVFRLGSFTKQFTVLALLLLQDQGKLSIDDLITTYLPNYPTHGRNISIFHLLNHQSGIPNYTALAPFIEQWATIEMSHEQFIALFKDLPLEFEPGARFKYSNSGYYLLGQIIEAVSGMNYEAFVRKQIFQPLDMQHSYYMSNRPIIPYRAAGYSRASRGYQHARYISMTQPYAAGGFGSTVKDLVLLDQGLREHRLIDQATQERMYTRVDQVPGQMKDMGLGWWLANYHGYRVTYLPGRINGFAVFMIRFLDDATTVIVLSNFGSFDPEKLARQISRLVQGISPLAREPISISVDAKNKVIGTYHGEVDDITMHVVYDGDQLALRGPMAGILLPITENTFYSAQDEEVEIRFEDPQENGFTRMILTTPLSWFFSATKVSTS
jgi:CubicO group peptidase (beta-lactamase class C family)